MHTKYLLPAAAKKWGWALAVPAFILMIAYLQFDFSFPFLDYTSNSTHISLDKEWLFNVQSNNFTDEAGGILLMVGLLLIAFSRERDEDERIARLRLESLLWATLINSILIGVSIVLFYNDLFLKIMAYNVCSTLILFVIKFNLTIYLERRKRP